MDQLNSIDASFLHLETPETPMHVGSLMLFELPEGYKGDYYEDVKAMLGRRLHLSALLTRKLAQMPFQLAEPVWIDCSSSALLPADAFFRRMSPGAERTEQGFHEEETCRGHTARGASEADSGKRSCKSIRWPRQSVHDSLIPSLAEFGGLS